MAQQIINNGESGLSVRTKINENFAEVYGAVVFAPGVGDGTTDDTAAINAGASAATGGLLRLVPGKTYRITDTVTIPVGTSLDMVGAQIVYDGPKDRPALVIGAAGVANKTGIDWQVNLTGLHVRAADAPTAGDLANLNYVGIRIFNLRFSQVQVDKVYAFTTGIDLVSDYAFGLTYNTFQLGLLIDNARHIVLRTAGATPNDGFVNQNTFIGGSLLQTTSYPALYMYGVLFTWTGVNSYRNHNNNVFLNVSFEIGNSAGAGNCIAVYHNGCGTHNRFIGCRWEDGDGPCAYCDGGRTAISDVSWCHNNTYEIAYGQGTFAASPPVQNVNGAVNNIYTDQMGANSAPVILSPPEVVGCVKTAASGKVWLTRQWLCWTSGNNTPRKLLDGGAFRLAPDYLQLDSAAVVGIALDTSERREFTIRLSAVAGFTGRLVLRCFDRFGAQLTSVSAGANLLEAFDTASTQGTVFPYSADYGGSFQSASDETVGRPLTLRVAPAVKYVLIGFRGGTAPLRLKGVTITTRTEGDVNSISMAGFKALLDSSDEGFAEVDPDSVGQFGIFTRGEIVRNAAAASAAASYWQCTLGGWNSPQWAITTAYSVDDVRYNGANVYICTTAGTSAGSGGPTGTGTSITDGTVTWRYLAPRATFAPGANLA